MFYLITQVRILESSANYLSHYRLIFYIFFIIQYIDPYLQYCNIARATKLFEIITGDKWNSRTDNLFKDCHILLLGDTNSLQVAFLSSN